MKKIKGTVTESLTVQKEVEIEISDELARAAAEGDVDAYEEINTFIRNKAYEETIFAEKDTHGWEGIETTDVEVEFTAEPG